MHTASDFDYLIYIDYIDKSYDIAELRGHGRRPLGASVLHKPAANDAILQVVDVPKRTIGLLGVALTFGPEACRSQTVPSVLLVHVSARSSQTVFTTYMCTLKRRHDKQLYRGFRFDIFVNFQMAIERVHAVEAGRSFRAGHLESEQARGTVALDKDWALSTAVA